MSKSWYKPWANAPLNSLGKFWREADFANNRPSVFALRLKEYLTLLLLLSPLQIFFNDINGS